MNQRELEASIHVDLAREETYGDYLMLDQLLSSQRPKSSPQEHDEMLFIVQHQTSELWMKLLIHELTAAIEWVRKDQLEPTFKILARIGHIQRMLFEQWSVLETLTPIEFLRFREALGRSSGFQSYQYRAIEFLLGNKDANALLPFRAHAEVHSWLEKLLQAPSLYDEFLRHLGRRGLPIPREALERDFSKPYVKNDKVTQALRGVYEDTDQYWDEYEMCEKLVDVEERFQLWRFRHLLTVHRIIGFRPGTGGSSGVPFLRKAIELSFFPELWDVRTELKVPTRPMSP
jgi:tryptophan 2,3-dioxygenase